MADGLFSRYRTGENRVTASFLAVLRALSLARIERLLSALTGEASFGLVTFRNQVSGPGRASVPDAAITSSCQLLIETKVQRDAVDRRQVERHLTILDTSAAAFRGLLILTPDQTKPAVLMPLTDPRLYWASFVALDQAIDELLGDKLEVVSEREAYLLRELQSMLAAEGLLVFPKDTVIVAARRAWPMYQDVPAYVCQPERPFQPVQYLGFYTDGQIAPLVPRIREVHDRVLLQPGLHTGDLGAAVDAVLARGWRQAGEEHKVILLGRPTDPDTVTLMAPIRNDRGVAFTMGQRYVRVQDLQRSTTTSELTA